MVKRLVGMILIVFLISGCSSIKDTGQNSESEDGITRQEFIKRLIETGNIQINYFKEPKASEYFEDVKDSSPYASILITAVDSKILLPENKKAMAEKKVTYGEAVEYINRAYKFKTGVNTSISNDIKKELVKMDKKYEQMRDKDHISDKLSKNMIEIFKSKLGKAEKSFGDKTEKHDDIKVYTSKNNGELLITLDWGRKSTGGYVLKIKEAKQISKDTIEVLYFASAPGPNDIVAQVITYPKDSTKIKIEDSNVEYKIVLKHENK